MLAEPVRLPITTGNIFCIVIILLNNMLGVAQNIVAMLIWTVIVWVVQQYLL